MDWNFHNRSGRIRIFGIRCGGGKAFFILQEAEQAKAPQLDFLGSIRVGNSIRVVVKNNGGSVAQDCYGKITLANIEFAFMPSGLAKVNQNSGGTIDNSPICWNFANYSSEVNIKRGENKPLEVFRMDKDNSGNAYFEIPSEEGYARSRSLPEILPSGANIEITNHSLAYINAKTYKGKLIVGANDTNPIEKNIEIGLTSDNQPNLIFL